MYKYSRPDGEKVVISQREYNKHFYPRGRWPFTETEVYITNDIITLQFVTTLLGKIFLTAIFPLSVLVYGTPEAVEQLKSVWFEKEKGHFGREVIFCDQNSEAYQKIQKILLKSRT